MKKYLFGLLALGLSLTFFACEKEEDNLTSSEEELINAIATSEDKLLISPFEDLPAEVVAFVENKFSPYGIESAWAVAEKGYETGLDDGQFCYFNQSGRFLGKQRYRRPHRNFGRRCMMGDTIDTAELLATTATYIADNYPGETIEIALLKPYGGYAVQLSNEDVLLFDVDGAYVRNCGGTTYCLMGDTLTTADLPDTTLTFLAENFAEESIQTVVQKWNGWYAVELSNGDVLAFNADGVFVRTCGKPELPGFEDLLQEMQDYILANYPDAEVLRVVEFANGNWVVFLSGPVRLLFDADGNILFDSGE